MTTTTTINPYDAIHAYREAGVVDSWRQTPYSDREVMVVALLNDATRTRIERAGPDLDAALRKILWAIEGRGETGARAILEDHDQ